MGEVNGYVQFVQEPAGFLVIAVLLALGETKLAVVTVRVVVQIDDPSGMVQFVAVREPEGDANVPVSKMARVAVVEDVRVPGLLPPPEQV